MTYECNDELANLLKELRAEQKGFFTSKPGTLQRQNHLKESKRLEKELDKFIQEQKAGKAVGVRASRVILIFHTKQLYNVRKNKTIGVDTHLEV
jgi:uncharacterized protein YhaN